MLYFTDPLIGASISLRRSILGEISEEVKRGQFSHHNLKMKSFSQNRENELPVTTCLIHLWRSGSQVARLRGRLKAPKPVKT